MKKFYIFLKIFYICQTSFLIIISIVVLKSYLSQGHYLDSLLFIFMILVMMGIATFILMAHRKLIIEMIFDENNTIIITNGNKFILSSDKFIKVENTGLGKIVFTYKTNELQKKFVFQQKYFIFTYSLDIVKIKENMINADFYGFFNK